MYNESILTYFKERGIETVFNFSFIFVLFILVIMMLFVHFIEYRNNSGSGRWMSPIKINLWLALGYVWFLNYLYCILRRQISLLENSFGAMGSLLFAAMIIFVCYPKISKVCQLFFVKRYTCILLLGIASISLPYGIFLLVILSGFLAVMLELRYLKRKKLS